MQHIPSSAQKFITVHLYIYTHTYIYIYLRSEKRSQVHNPTLKN